MSITVPTQAHAVAGDKFSFFLHNYEDNDPREVFNTVLYKEDQRYFQTLCRVIVYWKILGQNCTLNFGFSPITQKLIQSENLNSNWIY